MTNYRELVKANETRAKDNRCAGCRCEIEAQFHADGLSYCSSDCHLAACAATIEDEEWEALGAEYD